MSAVSREYEILPRVFGGWRLVLIEDGVEMGGGAFEGDEGYADALDAGEEWLNNKTNSGGPEHGRMV